MPAISVEVLQPPNGVNLVSTGRSTARVTWEAMSKVLLYQVAVTDSDPAKAPVIRNTSATSMDIGHLEPCSSYTIGVSSVNVFLVPGEPYNNSYSTSSECYNSTETEGFFSGEDSVAFVSPNFQP